MKLRNAFLVGVFIFVALVDCVFPLPGDAGDEFQLWWQVEMTMSVSGSYRYTHNNNDYQGRYAFDVVAAASMDLDSSKDFILYPGETKIIDLDWKETGKNLSEKMEPGVRMSYV
ncbi:MAG: hypothetical protein GY950_09570, partial [bacterium]|nr:hypothetical protein [bacterium]